MPRVTLDGNEQKKKEIRAWIDSGMALAGIDTYAKLAKRLRMSPSTFSRRYANPETLTLGEQWKLEWIIGEKRGND